jgi:hypothetical protein
MWVAWRHLDQCLVTPGVAVNINLASFVLVATTASGRAAGCRPVGVSAGDWARSIVALLGHMFVCTSSTNLFVGCLSDTSFCGVLGIGVSKRFDASGPSFGSRATAGAVTTTGEIGQIAVTGTVVQYAILFLSVLAVIARTTSRFHSHFGPEALLGGSAARGGAAGPIGPITPGAVDWAIAVEALLEFVQGGARCAVVGWGTFNCGGARLGTAPASYRAAAPCGPIFQLTVLWASLFVAELHLLHLAAFLPTVFRHQWAKDGSGAVLETLVAALAALVPVAPFCHSAVDRAFCFIASLRFHRVVASCSSGSTFALEKSGTEPDALAACPRAVAKTRP